MSVDEAARIHHAARRRAGLAAQVLVISIAVAYHHHM
jgi:hypothetical protein